MSDSGDKRTVARIKTGSFERKLSLTKAGLFAGTRMAAHLAGNLFGSEATREARHRQAMSQQAHYLVEELGRLKGSVVKIGQMMALYGEHFLPEEVTEALHTLEDRTTSLEWRAIREVLVQELGEDRLAALHIETHPIGAASLGQVHRAWRRADDLEMCLKVQYPGVADAVDSDLNAVAQLLRLGRMVAMGPAFDDWLDEVRTMMRREVDYLLEARTTMHFRQLLKNDARFVVPRVLPEFSSRHVMASSFESGYPITAPEVQLLSLARRTRLAEAALELFLSELFLWGEIQTDPNFGNYRIRIGEDDEHDRIVLLDFGAVQKYPASFLEPVCNMIRASFEGDLAGVIEGGIQLQFMRADWPQTVLETFAKVCMAVLEPLSSQHDQWPANVMNASGEYCWRQSDLPARVAKQATLSAVNRYFKVPPKEFVFLNRKLVGVYTFISVLGAEFNGEHILRRFLYPTDAHGAAD